MSDPITNRAAESIRLKLHLAEKPPNLKRGFPAFPWLAGVRQAGHSLNWIGAAKSDQ